MKQSKINLTNVNIEGHIPSYTFVLWNENFDELLAITLITKFRKAGQWVKVVGLRNRPTAGIHGIRLAPDLLLSQAQLLVERATCIVLPCHSPYLQQINNDPRIDEFVAGAVEKQATFIVGQVKPSELDESFSQANVIRCLEIEDVERIFEG